MTYDFNCNQPYVTVAVIVEKGGKFLLVKEGGGTDIGLWGLPAGRWDCGEKLVDGAARELLEETGYKVEPTGIVGFYSRVHTRNNVSKTVLRIVFSGQISGNPIKDSAEISEIGWFRADEIQAMTLDQIRTLDIKDVVKDYEAGNLLPLETIKFWKDR